jgi:hypothetical protein
MKSPKPKKKKSIATIRSEPFGRPREHDRVQLAIDLVEWAKLDTSLNLNGFTIVCMLPPSQICQYAQQDDYFRKAYELAHSFLAERRERKLNSSELHQAAYNNNAKVYDYYIRMQHYAEKEMDAKLKILELEPTKDMKESLEKTSAILDQLKSLQSASNKACKSNNSDNKS